jgi:hypothetical protein
MYAATAAFHQSGRRTRATVAPPTTINRACYWWRSLIQLRTLEPATLASATGHTAWATCRLVHRSDNFIRQPFFAQKPPF